MSQVSGRPFARASSVAGKKLPKKKQKAAVAWNGLSWEDATLGARGNGQYFRSNLCVQRQLQTASQQHRLTW